ncbi:TPA: hypothetical protein N0F65_011838, partial [Lagenidium giganteum]
RPSVRGEEGCETRSIDGRAARPTGPARQLTHSRTPATTRIMTPPSKRGAVAAVQDAPDDAALREQSKPHVVRKKITSTRSKPRAVEAFDPVLMTCQLVVAVVEAIHDWKSKHRLLGRYSVEKLQSFQQYQHDTSILRVGMVIVGSMVPTVMITIGLLLIPLANPLHGAARNVAAFVGSCVAHCVLTFAFIVAARQSLGMLPRTGMAWLRVVVTSMLSGALQELVWVTVAFGWRFPVPLRELFGVGPFFMSCALAHALLERRELQQRWTKVSLYLPVMAIQLALFFGLLALALAFARVPTAVQAAIVLLFPIAKIALKHWLWDRVRRLDDLTTDVTVCMVEISSAFHQTVCMQYVKSSGLAALIIVFDAVQALVEMHLHLRHPYVVDGRKALPTASKIAHSTLFPGRIEHQSSRPRRLGRHVPVIRARSDARSLTSSVRSGSSTGRSSSLRRRQDNFGALSQQRPFAALGHTQRSSAQSVIIDVDTPRSTGECDSLKAVSTGHLTLVDSAIDTKPQQVRRSSAVFLDGLAVKRRDQARILSHTLQLLFACEVLLFTEYMEVMLPLLYAAIIGIGSSVPNAQYNIVLSRLSKSDVASTLSSCFIYAALEAVSFTAMAWVVHRKYGFSVLHQLAFVLEQYWPTIQGKLIGCAITIMYLALVHQGAATFLPSSAIEMKMAARTLSIKLSRKRKQSALNTAWDWWVAQKTEPQSLGRYTIEKLCLFHAYQEHASRSRVLVSLAATPLPAFVCVVGLQLIPMNDPARGQARNWTMYVRSMLECVIGTFATLLIVKQALCLARSGRSYPKSKMALVAVCTAVVGEASVFAIESAWRFPMPFRPLIGGVPWVALMLCFHHVFLGQVLVTKGWRRMKNAVHLIMAHLRLVVIYALLPVMFAHVPLAAQVVQVLLFPAIKLATKRHLWRYTRRLDDISTDVTICIVEILASLYQCICIQYAHSRIVIALLVVADALHAALDMHHFAHQIFLVDDRKTVATAVKIVECSLFPAQDERPCNTGFDKPTGVPLSSDCASSLVAATRPHMLAHSDSRPSLRAFSLRRLHVLLHESRLPTVLVQPLVIPQQAHHSGSVRRYRSRRLMRLSSLSLTHLDSTESNKLQGSSTQSANRPNLAAIVTAEGHHPSNAQRRERARPLNPAAAAYRRFTGAGRPASSQTRRGSTEKLLSPRAGRAVTIDGIAVARKDQARILEQTLQLLFSSEVVAFIEFIGIIVPLLFGLLLGICAQLPSAKLNLSVALGHKTETCVSCVLYALLRAPALIVFRWLMHRKYGLCVVHQLVFLLEMYWMSVQGKLSPSRNFQGLTRAFLRPLHSHWFEWKTEQQSLGRYSIEKLCWFHVYQQHIAMPRVLLALVGTSLPAFSIILVLQSIPLADPQAGLVHNWSSHVCFALTTTATTFSVLISIKQAMCLTRSSGYRRSKLALVAISTAITVEAACIGIAVAWQYPLPYRRVWEVVLWLPSFCVIHQILLGRTVVSKRWRRFQNAIPVLTAHMAIFSVYIALVFVFARMPQAGQAVYVLLFPIVKLVTKRHLWRYTRRLDDISSDVTICLVEILAAIHQCICIQFARTVVVIALLVTTDTMHAAIDLRHFAHQIFIVDDRKTVATAVKIVECSLFPAPDERPSIVVPDKRAGSSSLYEVSMSSVASRPNGLPRTDAKPIPRTFSLRRLHSLLRESKLPELLMQSRAVSPRAQHYLAPGSVFIAPRHVQKRRSRRLLRLSALSLTRLDSSESTKPPVGSVYPSSPPNLAPIVTTANSAPNLRPRGSSSSITDATLVFQPRRKGHGGVNPKQQSNSTTQQAPPSPSRRSQVVMLDGIAVARKDQARILEQTLQLLFSSEVVAFVESIGVIVPVAYSVLLRICVELPSAKYNMALLAPQLEHVNETCVSCLVYALLRVAVFKVFARTMLQKYGLSMRHQLAFLLETYWMSVQGKLVGCMVIISQLPGAHQGLGQISVSTLAAASVNQTISS